MRKSFLTAFLALALLFVASAASHAASHAASGTYIDCIHGCPDLIVCSNCCNAVFSDVLTTCDANLDGCEALCPPGAVDCLNNCMRDRNDCLGQGSRDFVCSQWQEGAPQAGLTKSTDPTCVNCHDDDRLVK